MKRSNKLLISIVSIFVLTIGMIGLLYGFGDKNGHASNSNHRVVEQSKPKQSTKPIEEKVGADKSNIQESNKSAQADVGSNSTQAPSSPKNSSTPSSQKTADKKNSSRPSKQETTNQQVNVERNEHKQSNNQSETPKDKNDQQAPAVSTVTLAIIADKETGTILPATTVEMKDGDTVLDVLIKITKEKKIPMSFRGGTGATAYIEGIDNLFEFDKGQGSGWMYRVNGIFPNKGAGVVTLLKGDRIEWLYTLDLGKDLDAKLEPFR